MDRRKVKVLIVAGNVIAIIAIVSIILLYNYDTQSVTVDEKESRVEDPEENADSETKPSIEFRKINHSESVGHDIEDTEDDEGQKEAEKDDTDDEKLTQNSNEEQNENDKETRLSQTSETESTATSDNSSESASQKNYSSNKSNSNNSTASSRKSTSGNSNASTNSQKKEESSEGNKGVSEKEEEPEKEPMKEEVSCSDSQTKQNGKCVENVQIYYSKVQSRLPSGFSAGLNGSSIAISNSGGTVATINVNSVSQNKIHFSTNEEIISKIDGTLGGLIY